MHRMLLILVLSLPCFAEPPRAPVTLAERLSSKYFQLGISSGTPAGINFCAGYWFGPKYGNYMTQACGMHFGSTLYGLQLDFGKAFFARKTFRAYWAGSLRSTHATMTGTEVDFIGIGPTAGMNWDSLALELGLYVGSGSNTKFFPFLKDAEAGRRLAVQFGFQLGLKGLFWQ